MPSTLPLVSVVIINWNYTAYVGRAIDSVKQQDYPNLEVVVVDNGSTDDSQSVIGQAIADDSRFRLISNDQNLGQLGAFFNVYPQLGGDYVVNVDADDVLFPTFITNHVQAHLALGNSVGLTSSNVTIIDADDELVMHGYRSRNHHQPDASGLGSSSDILHLAQVDDQGYHQLQDSTTTHYGLVGWIWGPGTANMYRHEVLDMIYEPPAQRIWMRSSDNFLNPLCHAIAGTALIDQELSAYRVHGANYYGSLQGASGGRRDKAVRLGQLKDFYETTDWLLRRAQYYAPLLGNNYWQALRSVTKFIALPSGIIMPGSPDTVSLLKRNYNELCTAFSKSVVLEQLPAFFLNGDIHQATGEITNAQRPIPSSMPSST